MSSQYELATHSWSQFSITTFGPKTKVRDLSPTAILYNFSSYETRTIILCHKTNTTLFTRANLHQHQLRNHSASLWSILQTSIKFHHTKSKCNVENVDKQRIIYCRKMWKPNVVCSQSATSFSTIHTPVNKIVKSTIFPTAVVCSSPVTTHS
jgi:hypothetical protein